MELKIGDKAPDFELKDQHGNLFRLADNIGKKSMVIYFYPKDETPGCTAEACSFRDNLADFERLDCLVIGISNDHIASHKKFANHYNLTFPLLSDSDKKVVSLYGVSASLFGLLPGRKTFILNKLGVVTHIFDHQFKARQHVVDALNAITNESQQ